MAKINGFLLVFCLATVLSASVSHAWWPFGSGDDGKSGTEQVKETAKGAMDWTKDKMPDKNDVKGAAQTVADKTKDAAQSTSDFAARKGGEARDYLAQSPRYADSPAQSPRAQKGKGKDKDKDCDCDCDKDDKHKDHHGHVGHKGHHGHAPAGSPKGSPKKTYAGSPKPSKKAASPSVITTDYADEQMP